MDKLDPKDFAPYCIATHAVAGSDVDLYVLPIKYYENLEGALSRNIGLKVATVNRRLASHPAVEEALDALAEAMGLAVNQLAMCLKATGYKPLDKAVDTSKPH